MKLRPFGKTGLRVSEIGFGALHLGTKLDTREAVYLIEYALDRGFNFFDTAAVYLDSEIKLGSVFKNPLQRERVILCTKSFARDSRIIGDFENSLKNLQTDYIDIFMFHGVDLEEDYHKVCRELLALMLKEKTRGRIRYVGISSHSANVTHNILKSGLFNILEFPLNILNRKLFEEKLDTCVVSKGIGFLAMKSLAGGILSDAAHALNFIRQFPWAVHRL